jgi:tRNA A37 threonylcarbamoyladenosine synthetase subunit TsaC/SUA5/YrdC
VILPFQTDAEITAAIPPVNAHLAKGGLLAYPTETVYGLGSDPGLSALEKLARLKGRQPGKPFLLLVASRAMAEEWGLVFTPSARALSDAFWPGPLTLVLRGGVLGNVPPSTLVDCTDPVPRMVREGAIPRPELRRAAGRLAP